MIIKVDMTNAFDIVKHPFLYRVLEKFGFNIKFPSLMDFHFLISFKLFISFANFLFIMICDGVDKI